MTDDQITAALDQLAAQREQITRLDTREAGHYATLTGRLADRTGYGHLAAALGPCWPAHDLCLYALDIASALWSALYLQPGRDHVLLSGQAEYQARILPALAAQLAAETTRCGHNRPRSTP
jgi:hypothetical protein